MWPGIMAQGFIRGAVMVLLLHGVAANPCRDVNVTMATPSGDSCYFAPGGSLTWTRARRECAVHGGHLAAVVRSSEMEAVRWLLTETRSADMWLGGVEQTTGLTWTDGARLSGEVRSYPWADVNDILIENGARENCIFMDDEAKWREGPCSASKGFICQFDAVNRNCSSGPESDVVTLGRTCYNVRYKTLSWFLAHAQCVSEGGHVGQLGNQTLYDRFVSQLQGAPLYNKQSLWIGLRKTRWVWVTGDEIFWTIWESRQPDGAATCLSLHNYGANTVLWKTAFCSNPMAYICQREVQSDKTSGEVTTLAPEVRGTGLQSGLLFLLLLLLLVLAVIVIFLFCYYRRGRALRRQAREHAKRHHTELQNNKPASEQTPNFSIFTTCHETSGENRQVTGNGQAGHVTRLNNELKLGVAGDSPNTQKGRPPESNNNTMAKTANPSLNSSVRGRKNSKSAAKYANPIDANYDFDAEEAKLQRDKGSDSENVFRDIGNFNPPVTSHREPEVSADNGQDGGNSAGRDMALYRSSELFAVRSSMRIPMPRAEAGDSLVMESIQADEPDAPSAEQDADTDRSKYIEDVARAFDFLVAGDNPEDNPQTVPVNPPPKGSTLPPEVQPRPAETVEGDSKMLSRRARRDSVRSVDRSNVSGNESDVKDADMARAQRRLYGEKERAGSRRKKDGQANGAYTATESDADDDKRRRKHKQRSPKEGAMDSETEEEKRRRHKHQRHKHTEEELEEKRRRRKEREQQKQAGHDEKLQLPRDTEEDGLTRVGSPSPLGRLPPLAPILAPTLTPLHAEEKKKKRHRKHRKDMTPEEVEERRRRHKRKKEKERRRREREAQSQQATPSRIQVSGKSHETDESDDTDVASDDSADDNGNATETPTKSARSSSARSSKGRGVSGRRPSDQESLMFNIENVGGGEEIEV